MEAVSSFAGVPRAVFKRCSLWARALRLPFVLVTLVSAGAGAAFAWYASGVFSFSDFLFTVIILISAHLGANLSNDYFDHLSGNDEANRVFTPFNGGSRVIQEKLFSPDLIKGASGLFFLIAIVFGIWFAWVRDLWEWLWLGALGVGIGFFYTARPLALAYRGFGELGIAVAFGPLVVGGAYLAQTGHWNNDIWFLALPLGLLTAAILLLNEVPDRSADASVAKKTLVVRLGMSRSAWLYAGFFCIAYAGIVLGIFFGALPNWSALSFLTLPGAFLLVRSLLHRKEQAEQNAFLSLSRGTVLLQISFSLLLLTGILLA